jgi:hypothetical protein
VQTQSPLVQIPRPLAPAVGAGAASIPWRERPLHSMQVAATIVGVSRASLYRLASEGRLTLKRLAGRTLVETQSLIALIDTAEDWTSTQLMPARPGER